MAIQDGLARISSTKNGNIYLTKPLLENLGNPEYVRIGKKGALLCIIPAEENCGKPVFHINKGHEIRDGRLRKYIKTYVDKEKYYLPVEICFGKVFVNLKCWYE